MRSLGWYAVKSFVKRGKVQYAVLFTLRYVLMHATPYCCDALSVYKYSLEDKTSHMCTKPITVEYLCGQDQLVAMPCFLKALRP